LHQQLQHLLITLRDLDLVQVQHYASSRTDFFLNNLRALLPLATSSPKLRHVAQEDNHLWMPSL
jgi:hypothetical protein